MKGSKEASANTAQFYFLFICKETSWIKIYLKEIGFFLSFPSFFIGKNITK
jgi:hypothetical protein